MDRIPVIDMAKTGANIARIRTQAGISVKELQTVLGFATPQAIYKWQQGKTLPTIDNMAALACICRVRIDDIIVFCDTRRNGITA